MTLKSAPKVDIRLTGDVALEFLEAYQESEQPTKSKFLKSLLNPSTQLRHSFKKQIQLRKKMIQLKKHHSK